MKKLRFTLDQTGHLSQEDTRKYFSVVGFAIFAFVLVQNLASLALSALIARVAPFVIENAILYQIINMLPIYLFALPVLILILSQLPSVSPLSEPLGAKGWWGGLCCTVTMMTLGNYLSQMIILWFEMMMQKEQTNPVETITQNSPWWINLIFIAILAPILEELVFRKILCQKLLPLGEGYAILISAVIFGLCHGNFFQFFYAFGIGLILALVYVKTGKLIHTITFHAIINFFGGVFAPWILTKLDMDKLYEALETVIESNYTNVDPLHPYMQPLMLISTYSSLMYAAAIVGTVLLIKSRKKHTLDSGILPPPKDGKVANVFMNTGVAAALAAFTLVFITSLLF